MSRTQAKAEPWRAGCSVRDDARDSADEASFCAPAWRTCRSSSRSQSAGVSRPRPRLASSDGKLPGLPGRADGRRSSSTARSGTRPDASSTFGIVYSTKPASRIQRALPHEELIDHLILDIFPGPARERAVRRLPFASSENRGAPPAKLGSRPRRSRAQRPRGLPVREYEGQCHQVWGRLRCHPARQSSLAVAPRKSSSARGRCSGWCSTPSPAHLAGRTPTRSSSAATRPGRPHDGRLVPKSAEIS